MHDSVFIAYVGPWDIHDGYITNVHHYQNEVTVHVKGWTGRTFALVFSNVSELTAIQPVGMTLYALVEMSAPVPTRKFVFANWADDDPARLEIIAEEVSIVECLH